MEASSFFSGLLSGVDYRALVDAIISAQTRPINRLEDRIDGIKTRSDAYVSFKGLISSLKDAAGKLRATDAFGARTVSSSSSLVSASADTNAALGTHQVEVFQLASAEKLGSDSFQDRSAALGLSGEFLVNGRRVAVATGDTLDDIAASINAANTGNSASNVTASVVSVGSSDHRLILSSDVTGAEGIQLADVSGGILRTLGMLDGTTSIKHTTSDGALSDLFGNGTQTVAGLLGLSAPPAAAAVGIGALSVNLDLSTMSLTDIADAINAEASLNGSGITASVVSDPSAGGSVRRLDISGTTSFTDAGGILETLGVVESGKSGVAHELSSATAFQDQTGSNPATTNTRLDQLSIGGAAAGVQAGDTLTISGTRGDGSAFSFTYTAASNDRVSDLLARLNSNVDGLQAGSRTATASLSATGELVVTDDQSGASRLSLSIISNNEGGGTLDFGTIGTTVTGRETQISLGQDAQLAVDGVYLERSTNSVSDAIQGLTVELHGASAGQVVTVSVGKDIDAFVDEIKGFIDAYNASAEFVSEQLKRDEDGNGGPLAGDTTLRTMGNQMRRAMQSILPPGIAGNLGRLGDVGIEIQQDGSFSIDTAKLKEALETDTGAVERLFGIYGTGSVGDIEFVGITDKSVAGTYGVEITQAATQGQVLGTGFAGTYVDDATADQMVIKDLGSGASYTISLANGDSLQAIIDKINSEMDTALAAIHESSVQLFSDGSGTPATDSTLLQDLFDGGASNMGVAAGDTLTFQGKTAGGADVDVQFVVTDPSTQTVGELMNTLQGAFGSDTRIYLDSNGRLRAEDQKTGLSQFALTVTSDNAGGGTFSMGTIDVVQEGRGTGSIVAVDNGGQLELTSNGYGSAEGFEISFVAGGTDGSASLGVGAAAYTGLDVQGTIAGFAATGVGQLLTGDAGSAVEGISFNYVGTGTGAVGSLTVSRGIGSLVELAADGLSATDVGTIDSLVEQGQSTIDRLEDRIGSMEDRLSRQRDILLRRFIAAETALARTQQQTDYLFASLPQFGSGLNRNR